MSDTDTLNQSEEQIEEQNTEETQNETEEVSNESESQEITDTDDSSSSGGEDEEVNDNSDDIDDDKNDEPTAEQLNALTDEEFSQFLETGKLPVKETEKPKAKVVSKPAPKVKEEAPVETPKKAPKEASKEVSSGTDYEAAYKAIFKPFKANGKEITPKTIDDVISLMQMGANYTKKMQLLAPMKKTVESLNKANIDEETLNFLIDINNGDKEAIKRLLQKHKVDPLDLDLDTESTYVNNRSNIASDSDVEFSDALLEANDSLPKIREILDKQWDAESKRMLLKDPKLMTALHEEIQLNRFDKVQEVLEREKTFGRYKGVPDVQAYIDIVTKMVEQEKSKPKTQPTQQTKQESKPTKPVPDKNKAAPTRTKTNNGKSTLTVKDIMSMSEDEFNKLSARDLV